MRVRFIVTGDLEKQAVNQSFGRFFPATASGERVDYLEPRLVGEITTAPLEWPADASPVSSALRTLARALVAAAIRDSDGSPTDLVIGISDLELANQERPANVVAQVRRAVAVETGQWVERGGLDGRRAKELVRSRCSFHLFSPMAESYLFGEAAALTRAGAGPAPAPRLVSSDVENFETNDPAWLPQCIEENRRRAVGWWKHERHPKHYLEHLVDLTGGFYSETIGGVAGFATLNWPAVPASAGATAFARALFEDLAEALGVRNPLGPGDAAAETWPARTARRDQQVLRNL